MAVTSTQSSAPTSTQIRLRARPAGEPDPSLSDGTFETTTVDLPEPAEGEVVLRIDHLSLDPYMRGRLSDAPSYAAPVEVGAVMVGGTVGTVVASRDERYAEGDQVLSYSGWQTHAVERGDSLRKLDTSVNPATTALGVLGMPGFTAYAGLLQIGSPQPGETVVVAAAMGPVGSAVGQIARIKGARAVGIAGGPEKAAALTEDFGFDVGLDHRADDFAERLAQAVPDGVDVYFENVGGSVAAQVRRHLNGFARIPVCGLVADYNLDLGATGAPEGPDRLPGFMGQVLRQSLTVRGFIQSEFVREHYRDFLREMGEWVADGRVRYREDVVDGLENAPDAFVGMLRGRNVGKLLVEVSGSRSR